MSTGLWLAAAAQPARLGIFQPSATGQFLAILLFSVIVYVMIQRARAGAPMRQIHPLPGLDALDEAIGRATEMGRPVLYVPGIGDVTDPQTISSYPIFARVANQCARYDTRLIEVNVDPIVYAVFDAIAQESYLEAGRPDAYNPDDIRFLAFSQFSFAGGVWQVMEKEKPAANILWGDFYAECIMIIEVGALLDAVQIGANANTAEIPFFVAGCDYALMAEEMYAASAYLSKEPVLTGTVVGEDIYKFIMFAVIIVGALWVSATGHTAFSDFFKY
jgi:hypothetical protein